MTRQNSAAVSQQTVRNVSYSSETPTFSFSAGVTWFVADLIFSRRALCPAHSVFSSSISDIISSVVSELLSSFSSENRHTHAHKTLSKYSANEQDLAAIFLLFFLQCKLAQMNPFGSPASSCLQLWLRVCTSAPSSEIWRSMACSSESFTSWNWAWRGG